jgi:hypothetical protein
LVPLVLFHITETLNKLGLLVTINCNCIDHLTTRETPNSIMFEMWISSGINNKHGVDLDIAR